jgi:hypothetical protein
MSDPELEALRMSLPCGEHNKQIIAIAKDVGEIKEALLGGYREEGLISEVRTMKETLLSRKNTWGIWHTAIAGAIVGGVGSLIWAIVQAVAKS